MVVNNMEYRALYTNELEAWLDHVSHVFSAGRKYFFNHWINDPWRDFDGIRVAVDEGKIVSTVRVFVRKMFLHGEPVTVGGIGEVSTRSEYRKRGLASQLLKDSIQYMEENNIAISMLHGGQRIYSVEGWESVPRYYTKKAIQGSKSQDWNVRSANFEDDKEVERISSIYNNFSRKFNGTFVRDETAYWTDWVQTESTHAWITERDGIIDGYVSLSVQDEKMSVKDFTVSEELFSQGKEEGLFNVLLSEVIAQMGEESLVVEYPAPLANGFNSPNVDSYGSTMYRIIQPDALPSHVKKELTKGVPNLIHSQTESLARDIKSHHIFWRTDAF